MAFLKISKNYYFSGTMILTLFFVPAWLRLPIRFALYLNKGALLSLVTSALLSISYLLNCHKLPEVSVYQ